MRPRRGSRSMRRRRRLKTLSSNERSYRRWPIPSQASCMEVLVMGRPRTGKTSRCMTSTTSSEREGGIICYLHCRLRPKGRFNLTISNTPKGTSLHTYDNMTLCSSKCISRPL